MTTLEEKIKKLVPDYTRYGEYRNHNEINFLCAGLDSRTMNLLIRDTGAKGAYVSGSERTGSHPFQNELCVSVTLKGISFEPKEP
jgi:hypothetical protein